MTGISGTGQRRRRNGGLAAQRRRRRTTAPTATASGNGTGHLPEGTVVDLAFTKGAAAGSGLAAFTLAGVRVRVFGGAQDGVGKCALGGEIQVLKARNDRGALGRRPRRQELRLRRPARAASSSRATPTRGPASGCPAPTWCSAATPAEPINDRLGTHRGARQLQGLRVRVHDRRPRRRARRPGARLVGPVLDHQIVLQCC